MLWRCSGVAVVENSNLLYVSSVALCISTGKPLEICAIMHESLISSDSILSKLDRIGNRIDKSSHTITNSRLWRISSYRRRSPVKSSFFTKLHPFRVSKSSFAIGSIWLRIRLPSKDSRCRRLRSIVLIVFCPKPLILFSKPSSIAWRKSAMLFIFAS